MWSPAIMWPQGAYRSKNRSTEGCSKLKSPETRQVQEILVSYIFAILYLSSMLYVYRFLWPLRLGWLLVCCLYKEVYLQIFKRVSFWLHGCCGEWEGWARKPVNHTSWVAVVNPTDRPKSVRNRCVIELFCDVVYVVILPFYNSAGVEAFVIGLSQISSFFSQH